MATRSSKKKRRATKKSAPRRTVKVTAIRGLHEVRVVTAKGESKLELRDKLGMAREPFSRLVNVSPRAIADVELKQKKVDKLQRNYVEVQRICNSLSEVVTPEALGEWFVTPNDAFSGSKPIEVIERGEIDRLWEMYYRLSAGAPA